MSGVILMIKGNSRGQIQLGETTFIIIFIILIIVFGLVFFSQAEGEGIRNKQQEFRDLDTISAVQYVTSLTELQCSSYGAEDLSCFDRIKLDSFTNLTENDWDEVGEYYVTKLGPARIIIESLYPYPKNWTIYNYTGNLTSQTAQQTQIPVAILNPVTKENSFGVLYLTIYDRLI